MTTSASSIEIVSASRLTEKDFWQRSALGLSLRRLAFDGRLSPQMAFSNTRALADVFNPRIESDAPSEYLVFVHDDVWIDDHILADRVTEACKVYDIVGVAGNCRRLPNQPSWAFVDASFKWDDPAKLRGSVEHGTQPFGKVGYYGSSPAQCELLDGVLLAARKSTLMSHGIRFDPRFDFHFYDVDFCRAAREKGLMLGVWPICITHQSRGIADGDHWTENIACIWRNGAPRQTSAAPAGKPKRS